MKNVFDAIRRGEIDRVRHWLADGGDVQLREDNGKYSLVMTAVEAGHLELADELRQLGAEFNPEDATTILSELCGDDVGPQARYVIEAGASPHVNDSLGRPLLISAAWLGPPELVQALLEAGVDVNVSDERGVTALITAAGNRSWRMVQRLLEAGADATRQTTSGQTAVQSAVQSGLTPIVRMLLKAGGSPEVRQGAWPPLILAAQRGRRNVVKVLLDAGANPNVVAPEYDLLDNRLAKGTTALMLAAESGKCEMVEMLLAAGADPTCHDDRGGTAMSRAAAQGHLTVVERLQSLSPTEELDLNAYSGVALLRSAAAGDRARVEKLLAAGVDLTVRSQEFETLGQTALHLAAAAGMTEIVVALLSAGADPDARETVTPMTGNGSSPLHLAANSGHVECVRALLNGRADPNCTDDDSETPLHRAAREGHVEVVESLVEKGAHRDQRNRQDQTPIMLAAEVGHMEIARMLYRVGLDDEALGCAASRAHVDLVRALLKWGAAVDAPCSRGSSSAELPSIADPNVPLHGDTPNGELSGTALFAACGCHVEWAVANPDKVSRRQCGAYFAARQTAVLRQLITAGANLAARNALGSTPLHWLVRSWNALRLKGKNIEKVSGSNIVPAMRLLLESGADANAADLAGNTALHYAARAEPIMTPGYTKSTAIKLLLEAGANPNARNLVGDTPLLWSAGEPNAGAMRALVAAGADVNASNANGETPLLIAIRRGHGPAVRFLLRHGADPNHLDLHGLGPLDHATMNNQHPIMAAIKKAGGIEHARLERQLHQAIRDRRSDMVQQLLAAGADPRRQLGWLGDALGLAVGVGAVELISPLIQGGADPNRILENGSPLLALGGSAEDVGLPILDALLESGADPNLRDKNGFSPLLLASWRRGWDVVDRLISAGAMEDPEAAPFLAVRHFPDRATTAEFIAARKLLDEALKVAGKMVNDPAGVVEYTLQISEDAELARLQRGESRMWAGDNALAEQVPQTLDAMRPVIRELGCLVIDLDRGIGCGPARRFVGLFPTSDPLAVVAAVGTFGNDDERTTPEIIAWLRETAEEEPWELLGCSRDSLNLFFPSPVKAPLRLANRMMALCSDVGHSGAAKLAEELAATRQARFWWD